MLVLSRKANEAITIGDDIQVTVLSIDADRVKLGIEAPRDVRVYRYETIKKVVVENRAAASMNVNMVGLASLKGIVRREEKKIEHEEEKLAREELKEDK